MAFGAKVADYLFIPLIILVLVFFEKVILFNRFFREPGRAFFGNLITMLLIMGIGVAMTFAYTFRHCTLR